MDSVRSDTATDLSLSRVTALPERRQSATLLSRQRQRVLSVIALLATDAASVLGGFAIAYLIRFQSRWGLFYEHATSRLTFYMTLALAVTPLFLAIFACYHLYSERRPFDGAKEYPRIISAVTMSVMLMTLLSFFVESGPVARGWIVLSWIALLITVAAGRFVVRRLAYRLRRAGYLGTRVLLIGSGDDIDDLSTIIRESPTSGLQIVGIIDARTLATEEIAPRDNAPIMAHITATRADALVVSAASVPQTILSRIVREVMRTPTALHVIPGMYEILTTGVQAGEIGGLPLVTMNKARITGLDLILKRLLDVTAALSALVATLPMILLAAALVRMTSPGPIFHRRRVVGQQGQVFEAWKFRTMYINGDEILGARPDLQEHLRVHGKLPNDPRITPIGQFLRRWSIDELPQLLNVLRGQMSLVGPRMITEPELDHFGRWRENVSTVKPGLTGLWQVSGRSNLGYEDRVRLDMHYIRNYSIWLDVEILMRTLPAVLHGSGAY